MIFLKIIGIKSKPKIRIYFAFLFVSRNFHKNEKTKNWTSGLFPLPAFVLSLFY